jgi:hypothetical protein
MSDADLDTLFGVDGNIERMDVQIARAHASWDAEIAKCGPPNRVKLLKAALAIERVISSLQREMMVQERAQRQATRKTMALLEEENELLRSKCEASGVQLPKHSMH